MQGVVDTAESQLNYLYLITYVYNEWNHPDWNIPILNTYFTSNVQYCYLEVKTPLIKTGNHYIKPRWSLEGIYFCFVPYHVEVMNTEDLFFFKYNM